MEGRRVGGENKQVAVVGGGIAGLTCARALGRLGYQVDVFEATEKWGGRIETVDLSPGPDGAPSFKAECGPMRFEPELQTRLDTLRGEFDIPFDDFPPPAAASPGVAYPVGADEKSPQMRVPLDSLGLLKLGVFRLFGHRPYGVDSWDTGGVAQARLELLPPARDWLERLTSTEDFDELRHNASLPGTNIPLHSLGFWNALYEVISPAAVAYIMHFGTFYHLMPDNPNAVEWAIFWLRLFKLEGRPLKTIQAGVSTLVEALIQQIEADYKANVKLHLSHPVIGLSARNNGVELRFGGDDEAAFAHHVVLALPKEPLQRIQMKVADQVREDFDSVIAFPLLKVFCVTETSPLWAETPRPQDGAWLCPTREIHYLPSFPEHSVHDYTMVLLYMDRPAFVYWQQYLHDPRNHESAEVNRSPAMKQALARVLFRLDFGRALHLVRTRQPNAFSIDDALGATVLEALAKIYDSTLGTLSEDEVVGTFAGQLPALVPVIAQILLHPDDAQQAQLERIKDYAIRDWSKPPFGAGCHAWKPGTKSWEVRARLRAFGFEGAENDRRLHVCGEAFSQYQGFIEGALESADDAVDAVLKADGRERRR